MTVIEGNVTDVQIRELLASLRDRNDIYSRGLRNDCHGALEGSLRCRQRCAQALRERGH